MRSAFVACAVVSALALPARAGNGFVIGLEGARGSWSASADEISSGSDGSVQRFDAALFTAPLDAQSLWGFNLHLGWNVQGYAAIEAAIQSSAWTPFDANARGGAGFAGGRVTYFPLQHFIPKREFDVGIEAGFGYAIAGGPNYGMDGTYASIGAIVEYYPVPWFSLGIGYRYFNAMFDQFFYDYDAGDVRPIDGFSAGWGTMFVATNFHLAPSY